MILTIFLTLVSLFSIILFITVNRALWDKQLRRLCPNFYKLITPCLDVFSFLTLSSAIKSRLENYYSPWIPNTNTTNTNYYDDDEDIDSLSDIDINNVDMSVYGSDTEDSSFLNNNYSNSIHSLDSSNNDIKPLMGFQKDISNGLTSNNFDLESNIKAADKRSGLDSKGKAVVRKIMHIRSVSFDKARELYFKKLLQLNGISSSGLPRDPKAVRFS